MKLDHKAVFVSGANRGIGKALVEALLKEKVSKVYAAARDIKSLKFADPRVVPVELDITNREQIENAARLAGNVDVLINNAGVATFASVVDATTNDLMTDMQVNYFGTLSMVNAFAPVIEKNGGGTIANVISVVGLASIPGIGGYSASKAALFSATQAMRAQLKAKNIFVCGIFPGPIDTDMAKDFPMEKASAQSAAEKIVAGIIADQEDIFPDAMSAHVGELWKKDPKAVEQQFGTM